MREYFMTTERLGFSKWSEGDLHLAVQLWGDSDVTRYICASGSFTQQDIQNRLSLEIANGLQYSVEYWPIFELSTGELVGCCGLRPHGSQDYELGFHLRKMFWRKGMAVEAAGAAIEYASRELEFKKLFAGHHPENKASERVLARLGFSYIGDNYYEPTGLYHPSYELLNVCNCNE